MLEEISILINADKDIDVATIPTRILSAAGVNAKEKELIRDRLENEQIVNLICKKLNLKNR